MSATKSQLTKRTPPKGDMPLSVSDTDIPSFLQRELEKPSKRISAKRSRVEDDSTGLDSWNMFKEEIKEMLLEMAGRQDNRLDKLEKSIMEIKKQNDTIQNTNTDLKKSMNFVSDQVREIQDKITTLEEERKDITQQIDVIHIKIENMERISKKTSVEIRNVPKRQKEGKKDLFSMIEKLHNTVEPQEKVDAGLLRDVYRLPSKPNAVTTTVVAEFSNTLAKENFLGKIKRYNKNKFEQLSSKHMGVNEPPTFIYVSEHLTVNATRLFFLARDVAKTEGFDFCWTSNGRVFLRKKENTPHILVKSEETLASIKRSPGQVSE